MNARSTAVAKANDDIDQSQQRALAAREAEGRPRQTAIAAMASRLNVSQQGLQNTLRSTVFSTCKTDEEFIALVIVANEYGLNPLTKEIYAFPGKGGGIVPMVSVDGWIRIMNEHPQFDGIEFENIVDQEGNVEAIESVIYRKDRAHPIKTIEYLRECKRNTDPWKMMPNRMLRNRALIQGARIAFGFAGIATEGDEIEYEVARPMMDADYRDAPVTLPAANEAIDMDRNPQTGMTEVDEDTARELDAGNAGEWRGENPQQAAPEEMVERVNEHQVAEESEPTDQERYIALQKRFQKAATLIDVNLASQEWDGMSDLYDDNYKQAMNTIRSEAYDRVKKPQGS